MTDEISPAVEGVEPEGARSPGQHADDGETGAHGAHETPSDVTPGGEAPRPPAYIGDGREGAPTSGDGIRIYDFRRPSRVAGDRFRTLGAMHEIMAASLGEWLTARFREPVRTGLVGFEETTFGAIVRGLPKPCAAYRFRVDGVRDQAAIVILDPGIAFAAVDRLLGGSGETIIEERALTGLEQRVAGVIADRLRIACETVWKDHVSFRLVPEGFESIPDLLRVAEEPDLFLAIHFEFQASSWSGAAVVYLPFTLLESALGVTAGIEQVTPPGAERAYVEAQLAAASVTVDVRFPAFPLPLGVLSSLREGMVLRTRIPVDANLDVSVSGQKRFVGLPGRIGQDLAVQILEPARDGPG